MLHIRAGCLVNGIKTTDRSDDDDNASRDKEASLDGSLGPPRLKRAAMVGWWVGPPPVV